MAYKIIETACFPNCYQLVHLGFKEDNAPCNFFCCVPDAKEEAVRRGWDKESEKKENE